MGVSIYCSRSMNKLLELKSYKCENKPIIWDKSPSTKGTRQPSGCAGKY